MHSEIKNFKNLKTLRYQAEDVVEHNRCTSY